MGLTTNIDDRQEQFVAKKGSDFDDRQDQLDAESEAYHGFDYQTDGNGSWASALPVKQ